MTVRPRHNIVMRYIYFVNRFYRLTIVFCGDPEPRVRPRRRYRVLPGLFVLHLLPAFLAAIRAFFRSRVDTSLEILALRQQVAVLKRKRPRPALTRLSGDRKTGDRRGMASGGLPPVLALALPTA